MWEWWIGALIGGAVLLCGIAVLALIGWATCRGRKLDDPTHPYLPPLHRPHERK